MGCYPVVLSVLHMLLNYFLQQRELGTITKPTLQMRK